MSDLDYDARVTDDEREALRDACHLSQSNELALNVTAVVERILAARTPAATADDGHRPGCQEYPTGWLCVADCTTVWHDKAADDGLRERVEAVLESTEWYCDDDHDWGGRKRLTARLLDATAAPTADTEADQ